MRLIVLTLVLLQEVVTLNVPVQVDPGATRFRVAELHLQRPVPRTGAINQGFTLAQIRAVLHEVDQVGSFVADGKVLTCYYSGTEAQALLVALNKADLSVRSLERRVLERCQTDGKLGGGVLSGTPE